MKRIIRSTGVATLLVALAMLPGCPRAPAPAPPPDLAPQEPSSAEVPSDWPRTFTDARGVEVTLDRPARRVVSISPGLTETVFALDAGDRLVGRSDFCYYPPEALDVSSVGGIVNPSIEAIVGLEPDLVLVVRGTPLEVIDSLRAAGLAVITHDPVTIEDVIGAVRDVGTYLGLGERADELAEELEQRIQAVKERALTLRDTAPSILFIVGIDPVFAAGEGSMVDDLIETAGGVNAAAIAQNGRTGPWPELSLEAVVELDPDVILAALEGHTGETNALALLREMGGWRELSAVRGERVIDVDPDPMVRAGPRIIDGLEKMSEIIHEISGGSGG